VLLRNADQRVDGDGATAGGPNDDGIDVDLKEFIDIRLGVTGTGERGFHERRQVGWWTAAVAGEQLCDLQSF